MRRSAADTVGYFVEGFFVSIGWMILAAFLLLLAGSVIAFVVGYIYIAGFTDQMGWWRPVAIVVPIVAAVGGVVYAAYKVRA